MKQITPLTQKQMDEIRRSWKIVDGVLVWARDTNRGKKINDPVGLTVRPSGHANVMLTIDKKLKGFVLSRVVWFLTTDEYPLLEVDHIDCDPSNNYFTNLRLANRSEQCCNIKNTRNKFGHKGVYQTKGRNKWYVQIQKDGVLHSKGGFDSPELAMQYRQQAANDLHGSFAR